MLVKLTPDGLAVCFYATMTSYARVPVTWQKRSVKLFARAEGVTAVSGSGPPSLCLCGVVSEKPRNRKLFCRCGRACAEPRTPLL